MDAGEVRRRMCGEDGGLSRSCGWKQDLCVVQARCPRSRKIKLVRAQEAKNDRSRASCRDLKACVMSLR